MKINVIWTRFSLIDYLLSIKLKKKPISQQKSYRKIAKTLKGYDIIASHSIHAGLVAGYINEYYNTPFSITWHGSDIHTIPWNSAYMQKITKLLISKAKANLFVSKALQLTSDKIIKSDNKHLLYNGVANIFYSYDKERKANLKNKYGIVDQCKVIAFVGGLVGIKNVDVLPQIFKNILTTYKQPVAFWIVGNGKKRNSLESKLKATGVSATFLGDVPPEEVPDIMNCIDVLILPSKNEGLPLVTVEALKCGANVVASDVGGIKEVVGEHNVFKLDENFISNVSDRTIEILKHPYENRPELGKEFSWEKTAQEESNLYREILSL